jgi:hypothetical protein
LGIGPLEQEIICRLELGRQAPFCPNEYQKKNATKANGLPTAEEERAIAKLSIALNAIEV